MDCTVVPLVKTADIGDSAATKEWKLGLERGAGAIGGSVDSLKKAQDTTMALMRLMC